MTRDETPREKQPAHQVIESLAGLFDSLSPDERPEAEEELRDAGLDPTVVGRRLKRSALAALGAQLGDESLQRAVREANRTVGGPARRTAPDAATPRDPRLTRSHVKLAGAIAAMLIMFLLGYAAGRDRTSGSGVRFILPAVPPPAQVAGTSGAGAPQAKLSGEESAPNRHAAPTAGPSDSEEPAIRQLDTVRSPAAALPDGVAAGDLITTSNAAAVHRWISPGVQWCLQHGLVMNIIPYRKIEWNAAYREATMKYGNLTRLAADGSLVGYVAGLPFPDLDPNDPQIALKIMWNYEYKPYATDDEGGSNLHTETGRLQGDGSLRVERHFTLERAARLFYTGRLYVDPKPELENPDWVRSKSSFHPLLEPYDLKGDGLTSIRYLDVSRQDDTWLYLPSLRRVRRLSSAQRSDALFGQDVDIDSLRGFEGEVPWFDWKYLGSRTILASFHAASSVPEECAGSGDFIFCEAWELRRAYVIEGTPKLPQYAYGKRLLFIDEETFLIAYSDIFDRSQQLWKVWINQWSFRKHSPFADATDYSDEMPFNPSFTMVDMQLGHATHSVPPRPNQSEPRWSFNQGAANATPEFFTVAHLVESGH
jgi:uncharacterized protein DUF1329